MLIIVCVIFCFSVSSLLIAYTIALTHFGIIVSQNTSTYQRGVIIITGSLSFGSGSEKKGFRYTLYTVML